MKSWMVCLGTGPKRKDLCLSPKILGHPGEELLMAGTGKAGTAGQRGRKLGNQSTLTFLTYEVRTAIIDLFISWHT